MYVTWSRILLFICTQETDDKKKGLKRLTAMFYVTSFISPDAEDRKRQHGLRGKIKKYSTQCNTTRLAWGFAMTRLWRPFQANAIRAKPWTWLFTITNKDSGHWKKKTKERRRRNRFFQVIKSRRSQSFQKCKMNLFRLCMLLPIVNKTTVLKFLRGPTCWYFRVDVNYDQLCIRLECNKWLSFTSFDKYSF